MVIKTSYGVGYFDTKIIKVKYMYEAKLDFTMGEGRLNKKSSMGGVQCEKYKLV